MSTLSMQNAEARDLAELPVLAWDDFAALVVGAATRGRRVACLFAHEARLFVVLACDEHATLELAATRVEGGVFPSLTPASPEVHLFEREIFESAGLRPEGHPWLKPVRFAREGAECGVMDYFRVEGEEVHEVSVGPVHAGVIEPGHFRFQCHGEQVFHLEISLGYQHRGVLRALRGGPDARSVHLVETAAGDASVAHATAYAQLYEALAGVRPPPRALAIRAIGLELERLANHTGDLGAMAGDVGYLPTSDYCGRLRGELLNLTALVCGNRFGRGLVRPFGVGFDLEAERVEQAASRLEATCRDIRGAVELMWRTPSLNARFEDVGRVPTDLAASLGLVGVAARASKLKRDVRKSHPFGIYRFAHIPISTGNGGDVYARAFVRWLEVERSRAFLRRQLAELPAGAITREGGAPRPGMVAVSLVEGWRGEVCHVALTDAQGRFAAYQIVDPSFHNWPALGMAMRGQQISDFPLCNKSFNLSYCGFDL